MERAIRSILALDPRCEHLELKFRSRADAELDVLLKDSDLIINDKWLDFHASHHDSWCSLYLQAMADLVSIDHFSCSHIVRNLHELILVELEKAPNVAMQSGLLRNDQMRQIVSECIDQMPYRVEIVQGEGPGVLEVSWLHNQSESAFEYHHLLLGRVKLHRQSTCAAKKSELIMYSKYG